MSAPSHHGGTAAGTVGGTLLMVAANIQSGDVIKTAVLAIVGAVVSFLVSLLLKRMTRRSRRPR